VSLIIDAIKKAQQLRLKELKGAPFFREYGLNGKKGEPRRKLLSLISISGSGILLLILLLVWGHAFFSLFIPSQARQAVLVAKGKFSENPESKKIQELPQKEATSVRIDKKPSPVTSSIDMKEKKIPTNQKSRKKKKVDVTAVTERRETFPAPSPASGEVGKPLTPAGPSLEGNGEKTKAGALPKPVSVQREGDKSPISVSDALVHFNQGVDFYQRREFLKAIQSYQKVIQLNPTYIEAYNNLGIIYQEVGNFDKALEAYQKAIEINPRYEKTLNNLGIFFFLKNRYEESIEAFQKALAINSNNIESHINLGVLFKKQGQFDKAIENYQKAISLSPLNGETHYNIGLLYEQLEKVDLAITHYQTFIQLSSKTHPDLVLKVQRHLNHLIKTKGKER
jgi:Flp pilus assembly protein TadD